MTGAFTIVVTTWLGIAVVTFVVLLFVSAPYGRHARRGWGPTVNRRVGWLIMEAPPLLAMVALFALGDRHDNTAAWVFLGMWVLHYGHRDLIYPWRMRGQDRRMPWLVVGLGVCFNLVNGALNGLWLFHLGPEYATAWLLGPRFIIGAALFVAGFAINLHADGVLHRLRDAPGEDYKIPRGILFDRVSCPNYLGELLEWIGWAVATWSLAGLTFAVWSAANLVPRALSHHRWYRQTFADYPPERRALIPFVL